jgi:prevent-host-death family protein
MRTVSSIDAKNRLGQLLDAAQRAPVTVTKKGRPTAVVMSIEDYERMRGLPGSALSRPWRRHARKRPSEA